MTPETPRHSLTCSRWAGELECTYKMEDGPGGSRRAGKQLLLFNKILHPTASAIKKVSSGTFSFTTLLGSWARKNTNHSNYSTLARCISSAPSSSSPSPSSPPKPLSQSWSLPPATPLKFPPSIRFSQTMSPPFGGPQPGLPSSASAQPSLCLHLLRPFFLMKAAMPFHSVSTFSRLLPPLIGTRPCRVMGNHISVALRTPRRPLLKRPWVSTGRRKSLAISESWRRF